MKELKLNKNNKNTLLKILAVYFCFKLNFNAIILVNANKGYYMENLESKRLILRKAQMEDIDDLFEIRNQDNILKYNVMEKLTKVEMLEMIKVDMNSDVWYLEEKSSKKVIGTIHKHPDRVRYGTNTCDLSYWLGEQYAKNGYMSEAMELVIKYIFEVEKFSGITCRVFEDNIASKALLNKVGFIQEGRLENAVKSLDGVIHNDCLFYLKNPNNI